MSVGLLVVRLLYCFYVFGHLSKWFTFSVFLSVIFCRVVVFYACTQRTSIYEEGELKAQKFNKPQKPIKSTIAQITHFCPFFINTMLAPVFILFALSRYTRCSLFHLSFLLRLLGCFCLAYVC